MITAITYILKWALCLALLYIPFALLLRKETFATFNRILLLGIIAVSAIMPTIIVTFPVEVEIVKIIDAAGNTVSETPSIEIPHTGTLPADSPIADKAFRWKDIFKTDTLLMIYLTGVVIALVLRCAEIVKIILGIRHCAVIETEQNGMTIHYHAGNGAPFSWFSHTVISKEDYKECGKEILLHEEGHYRHGHSWDMLLLSIVKSLQWFNPFAYMLANDLKEIHEYEADRYVLEHHGNAKAYQLLLLKKAVGDTAFNLANNFNQSCVRKRIMMMARKPSAWINKGKALAFAPMTLLFLFIFAKPEYVYSIIEQRTTYVEEPAALEKETTVPIRPAVETSPLPLHIKAARIGKPQEEIEPLVELELSKEARRLIERQEEHASETYFEHVNITGSELGDRLKEMNVRQCSARIEFIADKEGNAHSITNKGCNVSIAGSIKDAGNTIENCKREAIEVIERYVKSKKWLPAIEQGNNMSTIYDAHIILGFDDADNGNTFDEGRTMMAGSTPIN